MSDNGSPLATQVGGGHYKTMVIQPVEFSMRHELDACAHSILKYVSRHQTKNGRQDLEKADHFVDLRLALVETTRVNQGLLDHGRMTDYCRMNRLPGLETQALDLLALWIGTGDPQYAHLLKSSIRHLIQVHYDHDSTGD